MAKKVRGLGKGLDDLFVDNAVNTAGGVQTLGIYEVQPNEAQPRRDFDEEALQELAESIAQHGVLQPILVRSLPGGGYRIVAGERRWRASRMAGLSEIPAVVKEMTDQEEFEAALVENLQRTDLNPIEEALGYRQLKEEYGMTQEQIAKSVSKSRPAVANAMRLLSLPEAVIDMLRENKLTAGHAKPLLSLVTAAQMEEAAAYIAENGLSVRQAEAYCKKMMTPVKYVEKTVPHMVAEVQISLTESLGRKVKVSGNGKKGKIEIEYFDEEDLVKLAKLLGRE
jgi:ParB family chromosome partitioning protein